MARLICALALSLVSCVALAATEGKVLLGWIEPVMLDPQLGLKLYAKLDTGADTSSLDAHNIRRVRVGDKAYVRFTVRHPESGEFVELRKPFVRRVRIKRHGGLYQRRYVVRMQVCVGDITRAIEINLIDRAEFDYPMLLGRSALEGWSVVDPDHSHTTAPQCWDAPGEQPDDLAPNPPDLVDVDADVVLPAPATPAAAAVLAISPGLAASIPTPLRGRPTAGQADPGRNDNPDAQRAASAADAGDPSSNGVAVSTTALPATATSGNAAAEVLPTDAMDASDSVARPPGGVIDAAQRKEDKARIDAQADASRAAASAATAAPADEGMRTEAVHRSPGENAETGVSVPDAAEPGSELGAHDVLQPAPEVEVHSDADLHDDDATGAARGDASARPGTGASVTRRTAAPTGADDSADNAPVATETPPAAGPMPEIQAETSSDPALAPSATPSTAHDAGGDSGADQNADDVLSEAVADPSAAHSPAEPAMPDNVSLEAAADSGADTVADDDTSDAAPSGADSREVKARASPTLQETDPTEATTAAGAEDDSEDAGSAISTNNDTQDPATQDPGEAQTAPGGMPIESDSASTAPRTPSTLVPAPLAPEE